MSAKRVAWACTRLMRGLLIGLLGVEQTSQVTDRAEAQLRAGELEASAAVRSAAHAAFSASASDCSACSVSATFWKAVIDGRCDIAPPPGRSGARGALLRCSSVPPSKSGCVRLAPMLQKPVPGVNSCRTLDALPVPIGVNA